MAPITLLQPLTMALNQEVKEESNWSHSECKLSDTMGVPFHVTSRILVLLPTISLILRIG